VVAPFAALALRDDNLLRFDFSSQESREIFQYALITVACALPLVAAFRLQDELTRDFAFADVWRIVCAAGIATSASAAVTFTLSRLDFIPRSTPLIYGIVLVAGLFGIRAIARIVTSRRIGHEDAAGAPGRSQIRRVIVVGVDRFSSVAMKLVQCQAPRSVEIVAALDPRDRLFDRTVNGVRIVGAPPDLGEIVKEYAEHGIRAHEVWVSDELIAARPEARSEVFDACRLAGVSCSTLSEALNLVPAPFDFEAELEASAPVAPAPLYFRFRWPLEAITAAALLVTLAPFAAAVGAVVAFDLGMPLVFWQERIGRGGRKFFLYKFRTYRPPFDRAGGVVPGHRRMSRTGEIIRRTRLDEIPQLWNVVRGEMSLIGPRPLLPVDQPADPRTRLLVRPGITGWAQVNGATALTADEKEALDAWYIRHASLALDLRVALRTIRYLGRGERKDGGAIEEAVEWRRNTRSLDDRLLADQSPEHAFEAERPSTIERFNAVKAAS
jgi:lipopolysaccharide/colanic/teichoic acid biosynthesis glycosyltransferase